jgi:hypothetical protein
MMARVPKNRIKQIAGILFGQRDIRSKNGETNSVAEARAGLGINAGNWNAHGKTRVGVLLSSFSRSPLPAGRVDFAFLLRDTATLVLL